MQRGDIFFTELPRPAGPPGHEQHGTRPAVVIQEICGELSTVVIVPMTSNKAALRFEGCFLVNMSTENGLSSDSVALVTQVRAIDTRRLKNKAGTLSGDDMEALQSSLARLLGLT